jgi:hypothetical protein
MSVAVQKFADTPISAAAMNDLSRVKTADEMTLDFPWDITSPEGIIAFFGAKMETTDASLKKLMYSQEARNAASTGMKSMKDLIGSMGDQRIEPGTPKYEEFKRLAAEIGPTLGGSADERSVKASIDAMLAPGHFEKQFDVDSDKQALADFKAAHPDAEFVGSNTVGPKIQTMTFSIENAPQAIDPAAAKDLSSKLTTITDSYTSASQLDMINVQNLVNQISQITSLASNIVRSFNEAAMGPIGNLK